MKFIRALLVMLVVLVVAGLLLMEWSRADEIHTGGKTGSYFNEICPAVQESIAKEYFKFPCKPSAGSGANIENTTANPKAVGFSQNDVKLSARTNLHSVKSGIFECFYGVTMDESIKSMLDVSDRLPMALPSVTSGSAISFRLMQEQEPELAKLRNITNFDSADAAVNAVIAGEAAMAFFAQLPNPSNELLAKINKAAMFYVPIVTRTLVKAEIDGEKLYTPMEVSVVPAGILSAAMGRKGPTVETLCTEILFLTGKPETEGVVPEDQQALISRLAEVKMPKTGKWADISASAKSISFDRLLNKLAE